MADGLLESVHSLGDTEGDGRGGVDFRPMDVTMFAELLADERVVEEGAGSRG